MKILIIGDFSIFIMAFALPVMVTGAVTIGCRAGPSRRFTATEISPCPANGQGAAAKAGPASVHGRQPPETLVIA